MDTRFDLVRRTPLRWLGLSHFWVVEKIDRTGGQ